jgi:ketosteroid isomerase-like protein
VPRPTAIVVAGWVLAGLTAVTAASAASPSVDVDALWDFGDPAVSEQRFRAAAAAAASGDDRLELLTQLARTHSLRRRFDDAHRVLDELAPQLAAAGAAPRVRAGLERGRTFNSAGDPDRARPLFEQAFELAQAAGLDALAVDAAHMVAITHRGGDEAMQWNRRALALAQGSADPAARRWAASLLNNLGWDLHERGHAADALPLFEQALAERLARGAPGPVRIARWAVARCLRSLGRVDEALAIQRALADELRAAGEVDGYVDEELGENLLALGRADEARPHFAHAAERLGADAAFARDEPARLDRLRRLAAPPPDLTARRREVWQAEQSFARSMADRDHTAFTGWLDDDALFIGPAGVLRGRDAVAAAWKRHFDGPAPPFSWEPDQVELLAGGDLALSTGPVRDREGRVTARFNSVWRRGADGRWRVVIDKGGPPDPAPRP